MVKNERQLTLQEKWELDIQSYKDGANILTSFPQCMHCLNYIEGDAWHCKRYQKEKKPSEVMWMRKECPCYQNTRPINLKIKNENENRQYGSLFGFCIGDIIGVPLEFTTREERNNDPVQEMRAYGTYHQPFGTWSDDTSLTLCLIDAINCGFSFKKVSNNFIDYYYNSKFTPHGVVFDIGNSTRDAIIRMKEGKNPLFCGGNQEYENGNGSLMRILPIAFYGKKLSNTDLKKMIEYVSALTHAHKCSKLACIIYVIFVSNILTGNGKLEALDQTICYVKNNCAMEYASEMEKYHRILNKEIVDVSIDSVKSTGYVVDTLEATLWSFYNTSGYREAILKAVNLGGDTDTIAALVGGISGGYYGFSAIPNNWVQSIVEKEKIYHMFEVFCKVMN